jgi:hypothetical protein
MRMMYVATVEVATKHQVDVDEAMRMLADYRPTLGTSSRGWVKVQMVFPATGLAHACTKAAAIARAATGAEALACQVMTEGEYQGRHGALTGSEPAGRHAAVLEEKAWTLPRQSTEAWTRPQRQAGRHSA